MADRLQRQQVEGRRVGRIAWFWPAVLPRNLLLLAIVLFHGFRRLAPPY